MELLIVLVVRIQFFCICTMFFLLRTITFDTNLGIQMQTRHVLNHAQAFLLFY